MLNGFPSGFLIYMFIFAFNRFSLQIQYALISVTRTMLSSKKLNQVRNCFFFIGQSIANFLYCNRSIVTTLVLVLVALTLRDVKDTPGM